MKITILIITLVTVATALLRLGQEGTVQDRKARSKKSGTDGQGRT